MLRLRFIAILLEIKSMLDDGDIGEAKAAIDSIVKELSSKEEKN